MAAGPTWVIGVSPRQRSRLIAGAPRRQKLPVFTTYTSSLDMSWVMAARLAWPSLLTSRPLQD